MPFLYWKSSGGSVGGRRGGPSALLLLGPVPKHLGEEDICSLLCAGIGADLSHSTCLRKPSAQSLTQTPPVRDQGLPLPANQSVPQCMFVKLCVWNGVSTVKEQTVLCGARCGGAWTWP